MLRMSPARVAAMKPAPRRPTQTRDQTSPSLAPPVLSASWLPPLPGGTPLLAVEACALHASVKERTIAAAIGTEMILARFDSYSPQL
jgi:hypothetical protein